MFLKHDRFENVAEVIAWNLTRTPCESSAVLVKYSNNTIHEWEIADCVVFEKEADDNYRKKSESMLNAMSDIMSNIIEVNRVIISTGSISKDSHCHELIKISVARLLQWLHE